MKTTSLSICSAVAFGAVMLIVASTQAHGQLTTAASLDTATIPFPMSEAFPELLPDWAARPEINTDPVTMQDALTLVGPGMTYELPPLTDEEVAAADARSAAQDGHIRPGPVRLGMVRSIGELPLYVPDNCDRAEAPGETDGKWLLSIRSPGAFEVRVHLAGVELGRDTLLVYSLSPDGTTVRGPYHGAGPDGDGDFWPASVPGDQVFIEVTGPDIPSIEIAEIIHCDRNPMLPLGGGDEDNPEPCELDVMCFGSVNVAARQAVGRMRYVRDGNFKACSGTLINDSDSETFMPYFLTANHCVDETVDLDTLEVFWFFQKDPCGLSDCPNDSCFSSNPVLGTPNEGGTLISTSGATVGNDSSFLRLKGALPPGVGFAGWTLNEEIGTVGIHHPEGSWKRAFFGQYESTATSCGFECGCFTPANYAFYSDVDGIVEPGSSGSAMFTSSGQVVGQLFGTCSLCPDDFDCFHTGDWCTQYGEWEQTYNDVSYWLQLGGTIWVNAANLTSPWNGLQSDPYLTASSAYSAAWNGVQLKFVAGNYAQNLTMNKQITLRAVGGIARIGN